MKDDVHMDKPLTDRKFIRLASGKVSAEGFLEAYSAHITEHYPEAVVALDLYRSGQMLPTPCLAFVKEVVGQHILGQMITRADEKIAKDQEVKQKKEKKPRSNSTGQGRYTCQLFEKITSERTGHSDVVLWVDHNGKDTFLADTYSAAERLCDRKQMDSLCGVYATITEELPNGKVLTTRVSRNDSVGRVLRQRPGSVCKVKPTSAPLKQVMSVHNYVATFSRG